MSTEHQRDAPGAVDVGPDAHRLASPAESGVSFTVQPATEADIPGIVEAYLASWRSGYEGLLPEDEIELQAQRRREHDWRSGILSPTSHVDVALSGDVVIGAVQATEMSDPVRDLPEITMLYVRPDSWGQGVAAALLTAGTGWIAARGYQSARLRVVESQTRARRFYEREGWQIDEQIPAAHNGHYPLVYYRRDDLKE